MQRRDFFKLLIGAPLLVASPIAQASSQGKTLILIELSGGNDGLNTLVPFRDKAYYQHRKKLALSADQLIPISEKLALHPALSSLLPWWKKGQMAWLQGLGYANPNRSHFSSLDIWETGSGSEQSLNQGWLARIIPHLKQTRDLDGISLATNLGPLQGLSNSLLLTDVDRYLRQANHLTPIQTSHQQQNPALVHIYQVNQQARQAADQLNKHLIHNQDINHLFGQHTFGKRLALTAQLLTSGIQVPVIKLSLGSFDTHNNQRDTHERLLKTLADGVDTLARICEQQGIWRNTLIMTYSEFGRRVTENASQGTDHGTAAPHFILGGSIQGGFYGSYPSLQQLDNGDLRYTTDFRQVYTTLTQRWWGIDAQLLPGKGFSALPIFKAA
jgi:uncharacterized protein (DUF1501 family)